MSQVSLLATSCLQTRYTTEAAMRFSLANDQLGSPSLAAFMSRAFADALQDNLPLQ